MSNMIGKTAMLTFALASAFALVACDVDKTQEGELPEVDVDAEGGQLPAYDVEAPEVDVGSEPVTVPVPDVDVEMPDEDGPVEDAAEDAADEELDPPNT